jgi:hypothetical protein
MSPRHAPKSGQSHFFQQGVIRVSPLTGVSSHEAGATERLFRPKGDQSQTDTRQTPKKKSESCRNPAAVEG